MSADTGEFDGSLVLEKLAENGRLDDFYEAVDADDFATARTLMKAADIDEATIEAVLNEMNDA